MRKFIGKVINTATLNGNHSMFSLLLNTLKEVAIVYKQDLNLNINDYICQ